jgi:hypothetical protein
MWYGMPCGGRLRRAREGIEWLRAISVSTVPRGPKAVELPPACRQAPENWKPSPVSDFARHPYMLINLGQRDEPPANGIYLSSDIPCVYINVAQKNRIYLDLCDRDWRAVEIGPDGWRIIANPPIRVRRTAGMLPLPQPEPGGSIEMLRPFLNVRKTDDRDPRFVLAVAWLLAALHPRGPYPILGLVGEQGTAKSFFARVMRKLVDPNSAPLRSLPREDRDLFIAAINGHVIAFDNISGLLDWLSDSLCRLATGGGFATRQLWTDGDEVLFFAMRPIILNGIEDFVSRPDLADRAILLMLEEIGEDQRRSETDLWAAFEVATGTRSLH